MRAARSPQMGEVQTLDKSHHSLSGLNLSLFLRFGRPVQGVHLLLCIAERAERSLVFDTSVALFFDEDPMEERLVAQPPVRFISTLIDADDVGEQPERVMVKSFFVVYRIFGDPSGFSGGEGRGIGSVHPLGISV